MKLSEAFATYLQTDSAQKTGRSAKADAYFLNIALFFLNENRKRESISEVGLEDLQIFQLWLSREQRVNGRTKGPWSDTTVEFYCRIIKKFFRKMHALDRILKDPCKLWKVPKGQTEFRRPMTSDEFEKIRVAAPEWFKPILKFMQLTGSRGASVASLTWGDVNFESQTLILKSRKGGLKRIKSIPLPMYPALFDLMTDERAPVRGLPEHPVFWGPNDFAVTAQDISSEGSRLIRKVVKLKGVVLYGLRHAIGAEMTAAGIPLEITRQAMGHSSVTQTSHYAKGIASSVVSDALAKIRGTKIEISSI